MGLFDRLFGRKQEEEQEEKPLLEEQAEDSSQQVEDEIPSETDSQSLADSNEESMETPVVESVSEENRELVDSVTSEQEFAPTNKQTYLNQCLKTRKVLNKFWLRKKSSLKLQKIKLWKAVANQKRRLKAEIITKNCRSVWLQRESKSATNQNKKQALLHK